MRHLRFEEEVEKRRVLEDALHVLATEHHALECSIGAHEVRSRRLILPSRILPSSKNLHYICIAVGVLSKPALGHCLWVKICVYFWRF